MTSRLHSRRWIIQAWLGFALVAAAPQALGQPAVPAPPDNPMRDALLAIKTWPVRGEPGQVVYTSPAKAGTPSMTILMPLIQSLGGASLDEHFKATSLTYISRFAAGRTEKRQGVAAVQMPSGSHLPSVRVLTDTIVFKTAGGKGGEVLIVTGWETTGGAQIVLERIPEQMPVSDLAVKQSNDYVAVLSGLRFGLTAEKLELQIKNNR